MTTPKSARMLRVRKDMAGVGSGPVMMTFMPEGAETGGEGGFEHVARKTGIFANDNLVLAVARAAEGNAGREAEP